jgi:hypothetical protein
LARKISAFWTIMTIEMASTSFYLDESIKETVLLAEEGV